MRTHRYLAPLALGTSKFPDLQILADTCTSPPQPRSEASSWGSAHTFVQQGWRLLHDGFSVPHLGPCAQEESVARDGVRPLQGEPCLIGREVLYQGPARFGSVNWGGKAGGGGFSLGLEVRCATSPGPRAGPGGSPRPLGLRELDLVLGTPCLGQRVAYWLVDLLLVTLGGVHGQGKP